MRLSIDLYTHASTYTHEHEHTDIITRTSHAHTHTIQKIVFKGQGLLVKAQGNQRDESPLLQPQLPPLDGKSEERCDPSPSPVEKPPAELRPLEEE